MQTILIPTDFSASTFNCIPALCEQYREKQLNLVFTHIFSLSDSITDLLMLSRRNKEYQYVNDAFYKACNQIKQEQGNVASINIEFFYGSTLSTFKDFLNGQGVDAILNPDNCSFSKLNSQSTDPKAFIERVSLPVVLVSKNAKPLTKLPASQNTLLETV